mmetsp:Transcript_16520/g.21209  ORF Transcript_16520/g.21209 Transcript_16520/m.21209 type:complete len:386 (-) Transcript_16520:97-1254(-)
MTDIIGRLKAQYGSNGPAVAEQLNSIGTELLGRGETRKALKLHQEALTILEWNKCNALLYDFVDKSKELAIDMALTLRKIGNLLREMNDFVGAAEVYKECLDTFLEGLIEGGGALKRKLLEAEYKKDSEHSEAILEQVDRKAIGNTLCRNPDFRVTVREVSQLFVEMQCVKFVGQTAASSRRRRRMSQHSTMEKNLTKAVESLTVESSMTNSMTSPHPKRSCTEERSSRPQIFRSMSMSSEMSETTTASEAWMECFYEKEMGRFSRPRPLSRRLVTSDDHYKQLSKMIVPGEKSLATAIRRFPLPASITGGNLLLKSQTSCPTASSLGLEKPTTVPSSALVDSKHLTHHFDRDSSYSTIDSETRTGPPQPETSSPVSVTRFLGDN